MKEKIRQIIKKNNKFVIFFHTSPDPDAVGSAVALATVLKQVLNKSVCIYFPEQLEPKLRALDPEELVVSQLSEHQFDVAFLLDSSEKTRLAGHKELNKISCKYTINIDHHLRNEKFGDINYVDTNTSSVGELIYGIINCWDIPLVAAEGLYAAILTDTGGFVFQNTSAQTFKVVSELVSMGVDPHRLALHFLYNNPPILLKDIGKAFLRAKTMLDDKLVVLRLNSNAHYNVENIVDFSLLLDKTEVSVLLREKEPGNTVVTLRSKSWFNVGELAIDMGGGGHKNAGGCTLKKPIDEAEKEIVAEIIRRGL